MTKGFKKFNDIMLLIDEDKKRNFNKKVISNPLDFINRFCSNLDLESDIQEICTHVCSKIEEFDLVAENTPTSKAAGSIYLVCYLFNIDKSKRNFK